MIERSDDSPTSRTGRFSPPSMRWGVVRFHDGKIVEWRDYCDDWVAKLGHAVNAEFEDRGAASPVESLASAPLISGTSISGTASVPT